jgi:hypothetical protein
MVMTYKLELTEAEADGLRDVLKQMLDTRNVELHRTDAFAYKELVKTRIELNTNILAKLDRVRPPKAK